MNLLYIKKLFESCPFLQIHVNDNATPPLNCDIGILQGSVVSPLLFAKPHKRQTENSTS